MQDVGISDRRVALPGRAPKPSLGLQRLLFILLPRLRNPSFGGEDRLLGVRSALGFPLPKGAALSVALEYSALQVFSDECVFFVIEWAL